VAARPLRFHSPLIKPDVLISRIRLSDQGRFMLSPTGGFSPPYGYSALFDLPERIQRVEPAGRISLRFSIPNSNGVGARIAFFEARSMFIHIMACALPDP